MDTGFVQTASAPSLLLQGTSEYLLVVQPDMAGRDLLLAEKRHFRERFGGQATGAAEPFIRVAVFAGREEMEPTLIRWMHRITSSLPGFTVMLNNYSGLPPHNIFLRVQDALPFRRLEQQLEAINQYVQSCACPAITFYSRPHWTIARRLPPAIYDKAMLYYSREVFHLSFTVQELVLLRRDAAADTCRQINVFKLLPASEDGG